MAYNLVYLKNRVVNDKLDDSSYDTSVIVNFLNDAQQDIANTFELPFNEKNFVGVLPEGERSFKFPDDYQLLQSVKITGPSNQRDISNNYVKFRDFNRMYPTPANSVPAPISVWTLFNNRMYVQAPLDDSYEMEIFYVSTPPKLVNDADVPSVPDPFEELLVLGAYIRALKRNEDNDIAAATQVEYNTLLDKLALRYSKRQAIGPDTISLPRNGRARRA